MLACKKQTNKFAEWHYYYNDCYMILPYEKHDNFADQSMKTYKKWEKTTMLHTLHTTHYTIHTHTQYTLLYEYIQLWLWRNDQLLKTIRKIIKTYLFVVPRRYQIPLKSRFLIVPAILSKRRAWREIQNLYMRFVILKLKNPLLCTILRGPLYVIARSLGSWNQ